CLLGASLAGSAVAAVPESAPLSLPSWWSVELPDAPPPPPRDLPPSPAIPSIDVGADEPRSMRMWPATARQRGARAQKTAGPAQAAGTGKAAARSRGKAAAGCQVSVLPAVSGGMRT